MDLDETDLKILAIIQDDASLPVAEIADKVQLSSSPCWRRIKRLEEAGVIQRRVTLLDPRKLGLDFEVLASVKLQLPSRDNLQTFENAVQNWTEIVDCVTVTGESDYVLRIVTRDMHAYDEFLREKVLALGLVSDVQSQIVMRVSKRTTAAPLDLAPAA
jgi:Lrp/AsnC family transcriptional regulator